MADMTPEEKREEARLCREDAQMRRREARMHAYHGGIQKSRLAARRANDLLAYASVIALEAEKAEEAEKRKPKDWQVGDIVKNFMSGATATMLCPTRDKRGAISVLVDGQYDSWWPEEQCHFAYRPPLEPGQAVRVLPMRQRPATVKAKLSGAEEKYTLKEMTCVPPLASCRSWPRADLVPIGPPPSLMTRWEAE